MNSKKVIGIVLVLAVTAGLAAWALTGKSDQPADKTPSESSALPTEVNQVEISGFAFSPSSITVKRGTTVTWTNKDSSAHNVISEDGAPAGGPQKPQALFGQNQSFSFTFNTVGTFPYFCEPHPFMKGTVIVTE